MPASKSKTGKRKSDKKTDKSTKQTVKQSVVVNVNTEKSKSSSKKKKASANVKSFTKGNSYLGGTPYRAVNHPSTNIVVNVPQSQPQPIFTSDIVNRVSALENMRMSQLTNVQQAQSMVQPLATQTPSANTPINPMTPETEQPSTNFMSKLATVEDLDKTRQEHVKGIHDIMRMSATGLSPILEEYSTPYKTPLPTLSFSDSPMAGDKSSPYVNPVFDENDDALDNYQLRSYGPAVSPDTMEEVVRSAAKSRYDEGASSSQMFQQMQEEELTKIPQAPKSKSKRGKGKTKNEA